MSAALAQSLPSHDCRVLAAACAFAIKNRAQPDWPRAWAMLSDLGRHVLIKADPRAVFNCALECWAAAPRTVTERALRRVTLKTLREKHAAEAVREIATQQMAIRARNAQNAEKAQVA